MINNKSQGEIQFKEKAKLLKEELNMIGVSLKHTQALRVLSRIEGYESYQEYCSFEKKKNTIGVEINRDVFDGISSLSENMGIACEAYINNLIEIELSQDMQECSVKLYKFEDPLDFDTYLVFGTSKYNAMVLLDNCGWPPGTMDSSTLREVKLDETKGLIIYNQWTDTDDSSEMIANIYDERVWLEDNAFELISCEKLNEYNRLHQDEEVYNEILKYDADYQKAVSLLINHPTESFSSKLKRYLEIKKLISKEENKRKK